MPATPAMDLGAGACPVLCHPSVRPRVRSGPLTSTIVPGIEECILPRNFCKYCYLLEQGRQRIAWTRKRAEAMAHIRLISAGQCSAAGCGCGRVICTALYCCSIVLTPNVSSVLQNQHILAVLAGSGKARCGGRCKKRRPPFDKGRPAADWPADPGRSLPCGCGRRRPPCSHDRTGGPQAIWICSMHCQGLDAR